jgi:hypothetical protein
MGMGCGCDHLEGTNLERSGVRRPSRNFFAVLERLEELKSFRK